MAKEDEQKIARILEQSGLGTRRKTQRAVLCAFIAGVLVTAQIGYVYVLTKRVDSERAEIADLRAAGQTGVSVSAVPSRKLAGM